MTHALVLVPTEFERRILQPLIEDAVKASHGSIAVCGFGPIASGIGAMRLLSEHRPASVILCGIAGTLQNGDAVGSAMTFSQVGCYGIGAGNGQSFQTIDELGWNQWHQVAGSECFGDVIDLTGTASQGMKSRSDDDQLLLTVCSASAGTGDVEDRLRKFPTAIAEDMEGYSVTMACRVQNVPVTLIRGISNVAGDRNKANWRFDAAIQAAAKTLLKVIK